MGAGIRPESAGNRITRNIAALRSQGASEQDIESYLTEHEGLKPAASVPGIAAESTSVRPNYLADKAKAAAAPSQFGTGLLRTAEQGATFGFGDELNAGTRALLGPESYQTALQDERGKLSAYKQANPGTAFVGELAGALAGGAAGGAVLGTAGKVLGLGAKAAEAGVAATRGQRLLRLGKQATIAAGAGGLASAGATDGTVQDRLDAVPRGAAYGAGAVLGLKGAGKVAEAVGITPLVASLLPRPKSAASLPGRVFNRVGGSTTEDLARDDVLKLAERARTTLPDLRAKAAAAHPDEMLLDVIGQPAVDRAGAAVATPSTGGADIVKRLDARDQRLPKSIKGDFSGAMGVTRQNTVKTLDQLAEERSALADETFGALRQHYAAPKKIDALDGLVGRPSFDKAVGETEAILRESPGGLSAPLLTKQKVNGKQVTVVRPLSFDEATLLKQTHDDVAKMATPMATLESGGVTKTRMGKQKGTHAELMDGLKAAFPGDEAAGVPSYETALSGHADKSKLIAAHDLGQSFMNAKSDELAALWPSLSEPEREFYRKGALASVEDYVAGRTDGHNPVTKFRNDIMRDKLRVIMPSEDAAEAIGSKIEKVHTMHGNRGQIVGNSKTANRLAQMSEAAGPGEGMAALGNMAAGNPTGILTALAKSGIVQRGRGLSEKQVDALAPLLTSQGLDMQRVLQELEQMAQRRATQGTRSAGSVGQLAGTSAAGSSPRRP